MSDEIVTFVKSYKTMLYYENDRVSVRCYEYRYHFETTERLDDLKECEIFELTEKTPEH